MRALRVVLLAMRARWPLLVLLLLLAPSATAYRDCFASGRVCATYDWQPNDAYVDAESDQGTFGAGRHGSGPFRGVNAYVFTSTLYVGVYEGTWYDVPQTLVTVGVGPTKVLYLHVEGRATQYPAAYHCTQVATVYARCGFGLP